MIVMRDFLCSRPGCNITPITTIVLYIQMLHRQLYIDEYLWDRMDSKRDESLFRKVNLQNSQVFKVSFGFRTIIK